MEDMIKILQAVEAYLTKDCYQIGFPSVVDTPSGVRQESDCPIFDHEFCDQHSGCCGDDFSGHMYFPLSNGKYLKVWYSC